MWQIISSLQFNCDNWPQQFFPWPRVDHILTFLPLLHLVHLLRTHSINIFCWIEFFCSFFTSNEHIYLFTHIKLGHCIACANFELEKQTLKLNSENQKTRKNKDCKDWPIDSTFNNILPAKNFASIFNNIIFRILTFYYNNQNSNNATIFNIRIKLN